MWSECVSFDDGGVALVLVRVKWVWFLIVNHNDRGVAYVYEFPPCKGGVAYMPVFRELL